MRRAADRAGRRLRHRAALARLSVLLPLPFVYAAVALAAIKVLGLGAQAETRLVLGGIGLFAGVVLAVLFAWFRRPPRWAGALLLDAHHGLQGRLATALELAETPPAERSSLAALAIEDGVVACRELDPRRAVPVPLPRELAWTAPLLALVVAIGLFEIRTERVIPPPPSFEPLVLSGDDLELFGQMAEQLAEEAQDPGSLAAIRRFNTLVEDIAARRLDRKEALSRLSELDAELGRALDAEREARELGLDGVARELKRSGLTRAAAQALEERRLEDAEKALRELAERLKRKDKKPSAAELARLRQAMERASRASSDRLRAIEARRQELEAERKSLLRKHAKDPKALETNPAVADNRRKLERLERDKAQATAAARELSELDRQLAEAARELEEALGKSAEHVERGAEDVKRMAQKALSEKEKRELLQRLRDLKEIVRRQGQGGAERQRQISRFTRRARGERGGGGDQPGKAAGGRSVPGVEIVPLPKITRIPGQGAASSAQGERGGGDARGSGDQARAGTEAGKGHDTNVRGEATAPPAGDTRDVTAAGIDTGEGTASAEVIYGAAERGFVGKPYREIFVQYETVAEEALEKDQIPPGHRFYVRRYFQLIRPRE